MYLPLKYRMEELLDFADSLRIQYKLFFIGFHWLLFIGAKPKDRHNG